MILAAMLASIVLAGAAPDEFADQLARLAAPRAAERAAAERWLQAHLDLEHYTALAAAARAGDAEVRGRLANVLSSDARHLTLALALSAEKDAQSSQLGREAVRAGIARSDPRLGEPALRAGVEVVLRRMASASPPRHLSLDARWSLAQMVEALELVGELPLGLALDPRIATKAIRREEELPSAPWNELVAHVTGLLGVELELHGHSRGRGSENPEGAFLRLTAEPGLARTGVDLISEWLFVLAQEGDENARVHAACNLASSGFAPALEWMDHLVRSRADRAALEGLLAAAARGRVAPVLSSAAVLQPLLAEAETQAGPRSARILCALARAGCFDERGEALAPALLAGFETAGARARWVRLFLLEKSGCVSVEAAALARALLADPSTAPALRARALHALAAQVAVAPSEPARVAGLPELFRLELDADDVQRLGRALRLVQVAPPCADPAAIPAEWSAAERLALLEAWSWRGDTETAAAHVAAWMGVPPAESRARGELLAEELRPWCARGAGPTLDAVLQRAGRLVSGRESALERVRLLLGLVPAGAVAGALASGGYELEGANADLQLLGALAGYPAPVAGESEARDALLARLAAALAENRRLPDVRALVRALERAAQGLYSAGRDKDGDTFSTTVLDGCRRSKTELGRWFERRPWPPAPLSETRDLARALARFELPSTL